MEVLEANDKTGLDITSEISHILTKIELDIKQAALKAAWLENSNAPSRGFQKSWVKHCLFKITDINTFVQHSCYASDI